MMNLIRDMIEEALDPSAIREALATHIVDMIDYDDIAESLLEDVDSGEICAIALSLLEDLPSLLEDLPY